MRSRLLPFALAILLCVLILAGIVYSRRQNLGAPALNSAPATITAAPQTPQNPTMPATSPSPTPVASPLLAASGTPGPSVTTQPSSNPHPDLITDPSSGLSKATVIMTTSEGVVKFKFYPKDAPNTVNRIIELINKGFYNGLTFHRVVPGFVVQGGDPLGNGTGGSGQKLKAEFNDRRHVEGTVAMARGSDPDSADSQFYISLSTLPHLDHSYTVFGQVVEGMDVVRKIKSCQQVSGCEKIVSMVIE